MGGTTPAIDYDALAQKHGGASAQPASVDFDALAAKHGGAVSSASNAAWDALKDKYGLPHSVDLSKTFFENYGRIPADDFNKIDIEKYSQAYQEAHPDVKPTTFWARTADEFKRIVSGTFAEGLLGGSPMEHSTSVAGNRPLNPVESAANLGAAAKERGQEFAEHPLAATAATGVDVATALAPLLFDEGVQGGIGKAASKLNPMTKIESALTRRMSESEAAAPRSTSESQPALNVAPRDVLQHASDNGVKLTPGQALEDPAATNVQKMGTTAMVGGKDLSLALREQRRSFVDSVNKLGRTVDPAGVGINEETAGHTIQSNVQQNLDKLKGEANASYSQVKTTQSGLMGNVDFLRDFANDRMRDTYQAPAVKAALEDIANAPVRVGINPSVQSLRNLRSEFWEKGNDYSGNIPDSARAIYKQAAQQVDSEMMEAGKGTAFEPQLRTADAQWKALQSKYNEPGQPLYKILQQDDPTKIVSQLQNAPATDITMLRKELNDGPAIAALRRSVVNDISNNKFTVRNDGLGGYSHEYLNALFGPATTKELYLKADLARRINYDANPSGTGSAMSVLEQGGSLKSQPKLTAFARLSMPRDAASFLPAKAMASPVSRTALPPPVNLAPTAATSPITGSALASPEELFRRTNP